MYDTPRWAWLRQVPHRVLNGEAITEPDPRGEPITDDSFLLLFNASENDLEFTLPPPDTGTSGEGA